MNSEYSALLVFYADRDTFERFEEMLLPMYRFVSKHHPQPNLAIPWTLTEFPEWPVLVQLESGRRLE